MIASLDAKSVAKSHATFFFVSKSGGPRCGAGTSDIIEEPAYDNSFKFCPFLVGKVVDKGTVSNCLGIYGIVVDPGFTWGDFSLAKDMGQISDLLMHPIKFAFICQG